MLHGRKKGGGTKQGYKSKASDWSNTSNIGKSAQASQGRAASNYYNHNITIFAAQAIIQRKHACCLGVLLKVAFMVRVLQCPMLFVH